MDKVPSEMSFLSFFFMIVFIVFLPIGVLLGRFPFPCSLSSPSSTFLGLMNSLCRIMDFGHGFAMFHECLQGNLAYAHCFR